MENNWAYGITTFPTRRDNFLKQTIKSLAIAGFSDPHLFVDAPAEGYEKFGLKTTERTPTIRPMGHWWLSLWELFIRNPKAQKYAIFQDDILVCPNLREYLERWYPEKGYLNLISFPVNLPKVPENAEKGWSKAPKKGKGAQGLVFDRKALETLLGAPSILQKFQSGRKAHKSLDGAVYDALIGNGYEEWIHNPSLLYHLGAGNKTSMPDGRPQQLINSFLGDTFDPLNLPLRS
jgi:hypothetical protein